MWFMCSCVGWRGGAQRSELCNQTKISSNVRDGGDEVFSSARQCGPVKSAVNPTSRWFKEFPNHKTIKEVH